MTGQNQNERKRKVSENRERIADIVKEMRGRSEDGRIDRALWAKFADRIEAAATAEREMWQCRVDSAMSIAREFKKTLDHTLNCILFAKEKGGAV